MRIELCHLFRTFTAEGYKHETVNYQQNYVDPDTGAHTKAVEHLRLDAKVSILKMKIGSSYTFASSSFRLLLLEGVGKNETDKKNGGVIR